MHYLPFGARLNKGILMVTQLIKGFSQSKTVHIPILNRYQTKKLTFSSQKSAQKQGGGSRVITVTMQSGLTKRLEENNV